jgi:hypothetical protein
MNKKQIKLLLKNADDTPWLSEFATFVAAEETILLNEKAGRYTSEELLSELGIRTMTMNESGIKAGGILDLVLALKALPRTQMVRNYVFKKNADTGTLYLDENEENIVGAIIVYSES